MRARWAVLLFAGGLTTVMQAPVRAADVETPEYEVVSKHEGYEVRRYGPLVLATMKRDGELMKAMNRSFMPLADYIGGENASGEKIEMTAPVIAIPPDDRKEALDEFRVSFILPAKIAERESMPEPSRDDVTLEKLEGLVVAVVRFSGMGGTGAMKAQWQELQSSLKRDGVKIVGAPIFAKYDPPWTLPWNRRNEVMAPVETEHSLE